METTIGCRVSRDLGDLNSPSNGESNQMEKLEKAGTTRNNYVICGYSIGSNRIVIAKATKIRTR